MYGSANSLQCGLNNRKTYGKVLKSVKLEV